ncbi:MAG: aldose 1-epimerase family protein [Actinomycetota bacterium]
MAHLWGRDWTRAELEQRVGDILQIGGVRLIELADGKERGVRAAQFRTGSGLAFTVLLDRGMDISHAEWSGRSLNWRSMTEDAHPAFFEPTGEPSGLGWVRTFFGGLMVTCGLNWAGAPGLDEEAGPRRLGARNLGLHGYISHTPAKNVHADGAWDGDEYRMWVRGKCQEALVFGENLILHREIGATLGRNAITVTDRVENAGFDRAEHMILYHINIGFPALDADSQLVAPSLRITPRDEAAAQGMQHAHELDAPTAGYHEKAYFHELGAAPDGTTGTAVVNRKLGFGAYVKFNKNELPHYTQWKMMGQRNYVVGMEPANCLPLGRPAERSAGRLQYLEGREEREYHLEIGALTSFEEIAAFEAEVAGWSGG